MDAQIVDLIHGIAAHALYDLLSPVAKTVLRLPSRDEQDQANNQDGMLSDAIRSAAIQTASKTDSMQTTIPSGLHLFLSSPDVEEITRQLYSVTLTDAKDSATIALIRAEFTRSYELHLATKSAEQLDMASTIFDALVNECNATLSASITNKSIAAHDVKDAFRHKMMLDAIASIKKNLTFLTELAVNNLEDTHKFETTYREQVNQRYGTISPPYVTEVIKLPIESIYVAPSFEMQLKSPREHRQQFTVAHLMSSIHRVVILGNPGAGKSTFSQYLCYTLTKGTDTRVFGRRDVTPILVTLREYAVDKKSHGQSILESIASTANNRYQVKPPNGAIEYLLLNGRALVIFDGLDELLDTTYRQEVSSDIESFCHRYPSVPVIVTSRVVGYEQAPLDTASFDIYRLAPFDDNQVRRYVQNWFDGNADVSQSQRQTLITSFIRDSDNVPDLRSNPLILALLCNIYRGEGYIPRNRPEVYERCATLYFEQWDKRRNIPLVLPFAHHLRPMMDYLAHWIYTDEGLTASTVPLR